MYALAFHFVCTLGHNTPSLETFFFFTSTDRQGAAPLAIAPTLGPGGTLQQVACVTGEIHEVVQVELAAIGEPMGRISRVSACDGCGKQGLYYCPR